MYCCRGVEAIPTRTRTTHLYIIHIQSAFNDEPEAMSMSMRMHTITTHAHMHTPFVFDYVRVCIVLRLLITGMGYRKQTTCLSSRHSPNGR